MFWIIVGALAFFFLGIPLILACITTKDFWKLIAFLALVTAFILIARIGLKWSHEPASSHRAP